MYSLRICLSRIPMDGLTKGQHAAAAVNCSLKCNCSSMIASKYCASGNYDWDPFGDVLRGLSFHLRRVACSNAVSFTSHSIRWDVLQSMKSLGVSIISIKVWISVSNALHICKLPPSLFFAFSLVPLHSLPSSRLRKYRLRRRRPYLVPSSNILHISSISKAVKRKDTGKLVDKMYIT